MMAAADKTFTGYPYQITLTADEQRAVDWVGHRDWNGDPLWQLLTGDGVLWTLNDVVVADVCWGEETYTFHLAEHVAWSIKDLYDENDDGLPIPYFAEDLADKFHALFGAIV